MRLINKFLMIAVIGLFGLAASASAITLEYTTGGGDNGPGGGFLYALTYESIDVNTYSAIFNITTPGGSFATDWWAGWFQFKFVEGNTAANLVLTGFPSGSGSWTAFPPPVNVTVFNNDLLGQGGRSGFYVTSLATATGNPALFPYNQLIFLTDGDSTNYQFTFTFTTPLTVFEDEIPFQVGFYDGATGGGNPKVITNRLSRTLEVPEPSTLLLLGAGLIGLGIFGRKKYRT